MIAGTPARVRAVDSDGPTLWVEFHNGNVASLALDSASLKPGDIVQLVDQGDGTVSAEPAPDALWPEEPMIGVVRLKLDDITVVDSGGRVRRIPTSRVAYDEGNTVEAREFDGVTRVLSESPLRYIDLPTVDKAAIDRFLVEKGASTLTFEDFGGMKDVVRRAQELIELPLKKRRELAGIGAKAIKGVLFTGPPGSGKTMLARIIAAQADAAFFEISGPEIFSKWFGQSGEVLRQIFERAAKQPSAIVFFDEIDSVAARRGEESHEETKRVVAQLLALMDGFDADANVVVIATTNRPDDIDPALRRPGRFDWEIAFPEPNLADRQSILEASARGLARAHPLPLAYVAAQTDEWTAADLAGIWTEAALLAVSDDRTAITVEDLLGGLERVGRQRSEKLSAADRR